MTSVPATRYVAFVTIAALGCATDLWTKQWVFARLGFPCVATEWLIGNYMGLQTSLNFGALFGIGQGQVWLFASLSVAAAIAIVGWLFIGGAANDRTLNYALAAIMAGILGNLYDRLGLWSHPNIPPGTAAVRDWILWQYNGWTWPNFNIADSLLVCGAATLFWHSLWQPAVPAAAESEQQSSV